MRLPSPPGRRTSVARFSTVPPCAPLPELHLLQFRADRSTTAIPLDGRRRLPQQGSATASRGHHVMTGIRGACTAQAARSDTVSGRSVQTHASRHTRVLLHRRTNRRRTLRILRWEVWGGMAVERNRGVETTWLDAFDRVPDKGIVVDPWQRVGAVSGWKRFEDREHADRGFDRNIFPWRSTRRHAGGRSDTRRDELRRYL